MCQLSWDGVGRGRGGGFLLAPSHMLVALGLFKLCPSQNSLRHDVLDAGYTAGANDLLAPFCSALVHGIFVLTFVINNVISKSEYIVFTEYF